MKLTYSNPFCLDVLKTQDNYIEFFRSLFDQDEKGNITDSVEDYATVSIDDEGDARIDFAIAEVGEYLEFQESFSSPIFLVIFDLLARGWKPFFYPQRQDCQYKVS